MRAETKNSVGSLAGGGVGGYALAHVVEQVKQGDILGATVIGLFGLIAFVVGHVTMNPEALRRVLALCVFAVLLSGCASVDATGPKPSLIPTAAEAGAITEVTVGSLLPEGSLTNSEQQRLAQYLTDAKVVMLGILDQEAPNLATFSLPPHEGLHLRHVRLLELAVQIALTRARPFVDQGQTQLAADYVRAILDGAIAAVMATPHSRGTIRPV